jgi:hypothetical protein
MSANVDEGAKRLGEKLLAEVEVEDLNSVGWRLTKSRRDKTANMILGTQVSSPSTACGT